MPKDLPVSNGNFLLNFDSDYWIRDIYFPHVGQENHSKGHPVPVRCLGRWALLLGGTGMETRPQVS